MSLRAAQNWQVGMCRHTMYVTSRAEACLTPWHSKNVPTSSQRASAKAIVKDHGPCVAMQGDIKIVAFDGSISELWWKIGININYQCHTR